MAKPYTINKGLTLFAIIFSVNILQSLLSPLLNDEAYYWLYAQHPAWGYLDHPPMVAFLIRMGSAIFPGEIGVRLAGTLLGSLTIWLIYKIIEAETDRPVNFKIAALLLFSSLFLNMYSFLAIPDTPMLFFSVLFLYTYRNYIKQGTVINTVALGIVTALLLYSKYHGVLLVGFTILSNPRLMLKGSFYAVFILAVFLYSPHLYWQYQNDFPTIRFQFFQRAGSFEPGHVFSYLGEQAAVTGPLVLLVFSILYKPKNQFQKTLKYIVAGIFSFFLLSSFKEMVNVHWTAIAFPAMLCLAYLYIDGLVKNRNWVTGILVFNLIIVLLFRINFLGGFVPVSNFNDKNPKAMTSLLKAKSGGHPLVFTNMYNEPSYFTFYGHEDCFAVNDISYKKTQFNYLTGLENKFQGKTVGLVTMDSINAASEKVVVPKGKTYYITTTPNFTAVSSRLTLTPVNLTAIKASAESSVKVMVENKLTDKQNAAIKAKSPYLQLTFINVKTNQSTACTYQRPFLGPGENSFDFPFKAPPEKGDYNCIFSLRANGITVTGFNSNVYNCKVE